MLTLREHPENTFVAWIYEGKKRRRKIFYHPHKNPDLRMAVKDLRSFNTPKFRDRFKLSHSQAEEIIKHLDDETAPEGGLQSKFFKAKKYVINSLYTEMDTSGTKQRIVVDFPEKKEYAYSMLVCAGSGSGKTWFLKEMVLRNLKGKLGHIRKFLWISNEYGIDKTIEELKKVKYINNFEGVDISDNAFDRSDLGSPEAFFEAEVAPKIDNLPEGSVVIIDDGMDSPLFRQLRHKINKLLRIGRHANVALCYILHSIKAGLDSQQASSSCRYYCLFPRSAKGKITEYLKDQGLTMKEARQQVADFSETKSRHMIVRLHAPTCLINEQLLRLY